MRTRLHQSQNPLPMHATKSTDKSCNRRTIHGVKRKSREGSLINAVRAFCKKHHICARCLRTQNRRRHNSLSQMQSRSHEGTTDSTRSELPTRCRSRNLRALAVTSSRQPTRTNAVPPANGGLQNRSDVTCVARNNGRGFSADARLCSQPSRFSNIFSICLDTP
jgi:hypothetical protein